ncbi:endolytic transglycosylase MltG [Alphaproteobacteria bacterium]|nr:endolytic transglycosylase MltG [Alphaproteobacteria bacterium]
MWNFSQSVVGFLVYGVTALVLAAAFAIYLVSYSLSAPGPLNNDPMQGSAFFQVERGQGLSKIANNLHKEGLINDPFVFEVGARIKGVAGKLQAGEYQFEYGLSSEDIMNKMSVGTIYRRAVTIPEGLTVYQIYRRLNDVDELKGELQYVSNNQEGMFLPDTYMYQLGETKESVSLRMNKAMKDTLAELWPDREQGLPIKTVKQWVTLASIVEKETAVASERKRVAGVFINRLRKGMPLQTDPTVIYAITQGKHKNDGRGPLGRRLLSRDLKYDSPYNTYVSAGLPPGPIANPGRASLEAVLHPEKHNYIFFVADGQGGHVFSETLGEHNRNVAKWRKIRAGQ